MKTSLMVLAASLLIAGCSTTVTKDISPTLRSVEVKDSKGNVVENYHEVLVDGSWYQAENKDGKWQLSAKGTRDKEMAKGGAFSNNKGGS